MKDVDVHAETELWVQPIFYAASWGWPEMVELLYNNGADIEAVCIDPYGYDLATPLMGAASWGYEDAVEMLVNLGADINRQVGYYNDTALHMAVMFNYRHTVKILLDLGADPNVEDRNGFTPYDIASEWNFRKIAKMLLKYGAVKDTSADLG